MSPTKAGDWKKWRIVHLRALFSSRFCLLPVVLAANALSLCLSVQLAWGQSISVNTSPGTAQVLRVYSTISGIEVRAADGTTPIFRLEPGGFVRFFGVVIVQQAVGAGADPIEFRDTTGAPLFRMEGRTVHFLGDVVIDGKLNGIAPTAGVYQ